LVGPVANAIVDTQVPSPSGLRCDKDPIRVDHDPQVSTALGFLDQFLVYAIASHLVEAPLGQVKAGRLAALPVGGELVGIAPDQAEQSVWNASLGNALLSGVVGEDELMLLHDISSKFEVQAVVTLARSGVIAR